MRLPSLLLGTAVSATLLGALLATPSAALAATGSGYTLQYSVAADSGVREPVRWAACAGPIAYRVNAAGGGPFALRDAHEAVRRVSAASGLRFRYAGTTAYLPRRSAMPATDLSRQRSLVAPLVIAWARPGVGAGRSNLLSGAESGLGGYQYTGTQITAGFVLMDAGKRHTAGFGAGVSTGNLLMHEMGHAVGLSHVNDPRQIMHPVHGPTTQPRWGAGDRAGLLRVGAPASCAL